LGGTVKALAIDFGGTHATCGLIDDRSILAHKTIDTDRARSLIAVLPKIRDTFQELLKQQSMSAKDFVGVGVGFVGIIDSHSGWPVSTNGKYDDACYFDFDKWSHDNLGLPLRIENDARMALLGEFYGGAARGFNDVVMMTLGTGIGGVAMVEGRLLRGKHFQAGCLGGHLPSVFNGRQCTCGAIGCAEAEASGWSLPLVVNEWPGVQESALSKHPDLGFKELFEEAAKEDPIAIAIRDRCLNVWAVDAVGLIHAYDPELVVIGGAVMKSADIIVPYVEAYVQKYSWTPWGKVKVRAAELGNNAALLGAIPLLSEVRS
jgi:glucokinase